MLDDGNAPVHLDQALDDGNAPVDFDQAPGKFEGMIEAKCIEA